MQLESRVINDYSLNIPEPITASRILVVEDERHIARFLAYVLAKEGYEVAVEHDAESALEKVRSFHPDALLLDMVLPGMSGLEMLRSLRANCQERVPVTVVLSARWFGHNDEMLKEAGADAQCAKPIAPATLIRKLHELGVLPPQKTNLS